MSLRLLEFSLRLVPIVNMCFKTYEYSLKIKQNKEKGLSRKRESHWIQFRTNLGDSYRQNLVCLSMGFSGAISITVPRNQGIVWFRGKQVEK